MRIPWSKSMVVAALLAVAGFACLGVSVRLLEMPADGPRDPETLRWALALGLIGTLAVFFLALGAVLAARRVAFGDDGGNAGPALMDLIEIQTLGDQLAAVSDDLRHGGETAAARTEFLARTLEVPPAWRPDARYKLDEPERPTDSLDDLRHTRDRLLDAADRVDDIVRNIREVGTEEASPRRKPRRGPRRRPWWKFR
jgi:signal transduction histidine kinase